MSSPSQPLEPLGDPLIGQTVGGYVVESPLGEGGMGLVYRARHSILNRRFAVKVLRPEVALDAVASGNFVREAQTLSSLKHPHVVDIVGFGPLSDGQHYMVMEFLEGRTLEDELQAKGRLPIERALSLADQMLDGLAAAHSVDVIHRDLKTSNVFLTRISGGGEVVKLLDFGLAKLQPVAPAVPKSAMEKASEAWGTAEYVAPEQVLAQPATRRSDLYSFGVMFFEMLTGELPFKAWVHDGDRIRSLLKAHLHQEAPSISSAAEAFAFPYELEVLVAELLKKDPAQRPASAAAVRARLDRIRRGVQHRLQPLELSTSLLANQQRIEVEGFGPAPTARLFTEPEAPKRRPKWPLLLLLLPLLLLFIPRGKKETVPLLPLPPATVNGQVVVPEVEAEGGLLAPLTRRKAGGLQIVQSKCEPTDRWRQASRRHLEELQQAAAAAGARSWKAFEEAEPPLSTAVASAQTGVECEAVERNIRKLADAISPRGARK